MPNLVGLRGGAPSLSMEDPARQDTLLAIQMVDLGIDRRDSLSTTDFKENKISYVPTARLESHRLVNKSRIGEGVKSKLEGWNNVWACLKDDGTDSQNLKVVNEGLGQTHRAKLMSDDSVRDYTGEENFREGNRSVKGGRGDHGGRGGGNAGQARGRGGVGKAKGERRVKFHNEHLVQPITRFIRVPKGHPNAQSDVPARQITPILKTVLTVNPAKADTAISSTAATSIRRPVRYDGVLAAPSAFMASIGTRKEQARDKPGIMVVHSATNTSKEGANGQDIDTSITKITKNSSETAMAHKPNTPVNGTPANKTTRAAGKPTVSFNSHPKADLMDLDTGEETTQPVLQFTASSTKEQPSHHTGEASSSFDQHIDALESSGILSAAHLEILKSIQTQVHARENATVPVEETPRSGGYTKSELVSLRPATAAPKVTTSIAKQFAEQQKAFLIGEHVHKTRYHTSASLAEDFENLSFSDKKPVKPTATKLPTTEKSTINPFGPAPAKAKGPSLPAHLLNKTPTADHGAAARVQYSGEDNALALTSTSLGDITATTGPTRRNMINQTGFIALAENRVDSVAAGKKGEDPLLVARN